MLIADVSGGRVRGRPRLGGMDVVKVALGNRGMTVEVARRAKHRKKWRVLHGLGYVKQRVSLLYIGIELCYDALYNESTVCSCTNLIPSGRY